MGINSNSKNNILFVEGIIYCYRKFIIIKRIMRLFHKYLKVPRSHFKKQEDFALEHSSGIRFRLPHCSQQSCTLKPP